MIGFHFNVYAAPDSVDLERLTRMRATELGLSAYGDYGRRANRLLVAGTWLVGYRTRHLRYDAYFEIAQGAEKHFECRRAGVSSARLCFQPRPEGCRAGESLR